MFSSSSYDSRQKLNENQLNKRYPLWNFDTPSAKLNNFFFEIGLKKGEKW